MHEVELGVVKIGNGGIMIILVTVVPLNIIASPCGFFSLRIEWRIILLLLHGIPE